VVLASLIRRLLSRLSYQAPEVRRAVIVDYPVRNAIRLMESTKSDIIVVKFVFATVELVGKIHACNLPIFVWVALDWRKSEAL